MRYTIGLAMTTLFGLGAVSTSSTSRAQETYYPTTLTPAARTFELQLSGGYTQGFGNISPNTSINNVSGAGIGLTGALAYRANPYMSLDFEGQYQDFVAENNAASRGVNTNVGITVHGAPATHSDPWLRLGTGWRWVWDISPVGPNGVVLASNTYSGWELGTARIGVDLRSSREFAFAPFAGADLQSFSMKNGSSNGTWQWGTYIYAGLQARFDVVSHSAGVAQTEGDGKDKVAW